MTRFKGGHMVWPGLLGHTINPQPMKVRLGDMKQRGATVISDRKGTVKGVPRPDGAATFSKQD